MFCNVILPLLFDRALTYQTDEDIGVGTLVNIPWRNKTLFGLVIETDVVPLENVTIKKAIPLPLNLERKMLAFMQQVAEYNLMPIGWVWRMVLGGVNLDKIIDSDLTLKTPHLSFIDARTRHLKNLNADQQQAVDFIHTQLDKGAYASILLDGVTGSGKTEVYFHSIAKTLDAQKQCLILLPEIGLSYQWLQRFEAQFGFTPVVWNSHTTPKKRREAWAKAISGTPQVFVGARSALFLPYKNLGLIIVDEEHDSSYKQEEQGHYHARDMAILKAYHAAIPIILASATPSLESFINAEQGKSTHLRLKNRFGEALLPKVYLIDQKNKNPRLSKGWLSEALKIALYKRLKANEQSLLFLNRRGYAPITLCASCGYVYECPGCSASLVQHRRKGYAHLQCHHCGFEKKLDLQCPQCLTADTLIPCGPGIDRVFEDVTKLFPDARVSSLTSDMTPKDQRVLWERMMANEVDIIIGTQMIAKGHHLPHLTLVGVIDGDMGLYGGDLRGEEKAFQLLQQVSGRAGREAKPGEVFIQTYQPENALFKALQQHDRDHFMHQESTLRKEMALPPHTRLISLVVSGMDEHKVKECAKKIALFLTKTPAIQVLGPAPALMLRLKSRYRYRILLKGGKHLKMSAWLKQRLSELKIPTSITLTVDVDPIQFI